MKILLDIVGFRKEVDHAFIPSQIRPIEVDLPQLLLQCLPCEKLSEKPEEMELKRVTFYPDHEEPTDQHGAKVWVFKLREEVHERKIV